MSFVKRPWKDFLYFETSHNSNVDNANYHGNVMNESELLATPPDPHRHVHPHRLTVARRTVMSSGLPPSASMPAARAFTEKGERN